MFLDDRLDAIKKAISERVSGVIDKASALYGRVRPGSEKALRLWKLWTDERFADARAKLFRNIYCILREIRPRKGSGKIVYGSGDPYQTGTIMQAAAVLYPFYEGSFEIEPVFEEKALDADIDISGHIHLYVLVLSALRVLLDKKIRNMYTLARRILND